MAMATSSSAACHLLLATRRSGKRATRCRLSSQIRKRLDCTYVHSIVVPDRSSGRGELQFSRISSSPPSEPLPDLLGEQARMLSPRHYFIVGGASVAKQCYHCFSTTARGSNLVVAILG